MLLECSFDSGVDLNRLCLGSRRVRQTVVRKMNEQRHSRARYVVGPYGHPLSIADLPPRDTKRWVIRRKAELVAAVRGGLLSASAMTSLSMSSFSWQRSIELHGLPGLRATRVQDYRE